jgi:hypothetical protein
VTEAPEPRVSDAERDAVVERLRAACGDGRLSLEEFSDRVGDVYRARTAADLVPLTHDLPALPEPEAPGLRETRWVVGVLSGAKRSGPWRPADPTKAVVVLGSCQLDLTEVDLAPVTTIRGMAFLGGIEVLVPEGVLVDLGGFAFLGGREDRTSSQRPGAGAPVVRVDAWAFLGGITVRTRPFRRR